MSYPEPIKRLISQLTSLPGVGEKLAIRYALFLLKKDDEYLIHLAKAIANLKRDIKTCSICHNYTEINPCLVCNDPNRDKNLLCIVANSHDIESLEKTGEFKGLFHVLGGHINILEGITPDKLKIKELVERIRLNKNIHEVIFAFNPDLEGETTAMYLNKVLKPYKVKITKLAIGLPRGADIEYADAITLGDALKGRREILS